MDLLAASPSLDYYFQAIQGLNNLRAGKRPKGLSPKAVYNAFLGHLVRGEVSTMHIRLAPNSLLKANIKVRGSEKVYQGKEQYRVTVRDNLQFLSWIRTMIPFGASPECTGGSTSTASREAASPTASPSII